jgi:hypothetical protein
VGISVSLGAGEGLTDASGVLVDSVDGGLDEAAGEGEPDGDAAGVDFCSSLGVSVWAADGDGGGVSDFCLSDSSCGLGEFSAVGEGCGSFEDSGLAVGVGVGVGVARFCSSRSARATARL